MIDVDKVRQDVENALPEAAKNPEEAFRKIATRLLYSFRQQFLTGGYGSWPAAQQPETGSKLMMKTGALFGSGFSESDSASATLRWGGGLPYARIRQTGGYIRVSDQSRKYFWAKFHESKDDFWKNMALSRKTFFFTKGRPINLTVEDIEYIAKILGTRSFEVITNYGPSIS